MIALIRVPSLSHKGEHYYCVTSEDGDHESYVVYRTEDDGGRYVTVGWSIDPYRVGLDHLLELSLKRPCDCRRLIVDQRSSWHGHRIYYRGGTRYVEALSCHMDDFELEFVGLGRNRRLIVRPLSVDFGRDHYDELCRLMDAEWLEDDIETERLLVQAHEFCQTLQPGTLAERAAASPSVKVPQMYIRTLLWWDDQFLTRFVGSSGDPSVVVLHELEGSFCEAAGRLRRILQDGFRDPTGRRAC